jgi:hypothetical protein
MPLVKASELVDMSASSATLTIIARTSSHLASRACAVRSERRGEICKCVDSKVSKGTHAVEREKLFQSEYSELDHYKSRFFATKPYVAVPSEY